MITTFLRYDYKYIWLGHSTNNSKSKSYLFSLRACTMDGVAGAEVCSFVHCSGTVALQHNWSTLSLLANKNNSHNTNNI